MQACLGCRKATIFFYLNFALKPSRLPDIKCNLLHDIVLNAWNIDKANVIIEFIKRVTVFFSCTFLRFYTFMCVNGAC